MRAAGTRATRRRGSHAWRSHSRDSARSTGMRSVLRAKMPQGSFILADVFAQDRKRVAGGHEMQKDEILPCVVSVEREIADALKAQRRRLRRRRGDSGHTCHLGHAIDDEAWRISIDRATRPFDPARAAPSADGSTGPRHTAGGTPWIGRAARQRREIGTNRPSVLPQKAHRSPIVNVE
jgi:hypothetical protein